jgi:hypothetical protein
VAHDGLGYLARLGGIHLIPIIEVGSIGLSGGIVMRKYLTHLPEYLKAICRCSIGTGNRANVERTDLLRKAEVGIARGQIDYDSVSEIGALVGIKRIRESDGAGVVLDNNNILIFHK